MEHPMDCRCLNAGCPDVHPVDGCVAVSPFHCVPDTIGNGHIGELKLRKDVEVLRQLRQLLWEGEGTHRQVQEHIPVLSVDGVLHHVEAERLNEPHMWQRVVDVCCEARQGTHKDGDQTVHLHLEDSLIVVVVLESIGFCRRRDPRNYKNCTTNESHMVPITQIYTQLAPLCMITFPHRFDGLEGGLLQLSCS